jgi:hypothetical protein
MIVTLDAKRRLTVPAALAPTSPGDYFEARFDAEEDALVFRRLAGQEDWLTVLKACPVSPGRFTAAPHRFTAAPPVMSWRSIQTSSVSRPSATATRAWWLTRLVDALQGRIHGFNVAVAQVWADQERLLDQAGHRMPIEDSYIAATARRPGLKVFNPFKELL